MRKTILGVITVLLLTTTQAYSGCQGLVRDFWFHYDMTKRRLQGNETAKDKAVRKHLSWLYSSKIQRFSGMSYKTDPKTREIDMTMELIKRTCGGANYAIYNAYQEIQALKNNSQSINTKPQVQQNVGFTDTTNGQIQESKNTKCIGKIAELDYQFRETNKLANPERIDKFRDLLNTVYEVSGECKFMDSNKDFFADGSYIFGTDNLKIVIKMILKGEDNAANNMIEELNNREVPTIINEGKFISFSNPFNDNKKWGTFEINGEKQLLLLQPDLPARLKNHENEILTLRYDATGGELYDFSFKDNTNSPQSNTYSLKNLRQGMNYSEARKIILNAGWQTAGARWQDIPQSGQVHDIYYTNGWKEIEDCAGTGLAPCRFEFQDINQKILVVITEGDCLNSNNQLPKRGEKCELSVSSWFLINQ